MQVSDFTHASSTHELLLKLLFSEVGLLSVASPAVQLQAIVDSFTQLQTTIVTHLRDGSNDFELQLRGAAGPSLPTVPLTYQADAQVFGDLYQPLARWSEHQVLPSHAYPLVGRVVLGNRTLRDQVVALLRAHIHRHGKPVGDRIRQTLKTFALAALVPYLDGAEDASPEGSST